MGMQPHFTGTVHYSAQSTLTQRLLLLKQPAAERRVRVGPKTANAGQSGRMTLIQLGSKQKFDILVIFVH